MENAEELANGGRVTRSLRKRLNSVDSDASSRPGTPVNKKLAPITETTALLTRAIRRNSTTTPVKTPLKPRATRGTTPDLNSPARRVTRRSSISFEDEHTTSNNRSIIKEPQFNALPEEELKETAMMTIAQIKTPNVNSPARRNTRPTSVSFPEEDPPTTASSGTLIKDSRFETLAEEKETIKASQDKKSATPAKGAISQVEQLDVPPKRVTRSQSRSPEQVQEQIQSERRLTRSKRVTDRYSKAEDTDIEAIDLETDDETTSDVNRVETLKPSKQPEVNIIIDISNGTPKSKEPTEKENIILREQQDAHNEPATPLENKSVPIIIEVAYLEKLTPMTIARYIGKNVAEADTSAQESKQMENTKSHSETTKSVTFNDSEEEEDIKSTYPKTPALKKSRSYIGADCSKETPEQDTSFQSDKGSVASFKDAKNELDMKEDQHDTSKESAVFHDASTSNDHSNSADGKVETNTFSGTSTMLPDKTPHKPTKLQPSVQSSTPIVENVFAAKKALNPLQIHDEQKEEEKTVEKGNDKETLPEKHSYITNDSNQNTDVDPLLFSPEKYLRSGKTYGNTPPNSASRDSSKCSNKAADLETILVEKEETSIQAEKSEYSINAQKPKSPRALIHDMDEAAKENGISSIVEKVVPNNKLVVSFSKSWSQSVSGKVGETGCKIDAIEGPFLITVGKDASETIVKKEAILSNFEIKRQSRYESDDEEQDESMIADNQREEEQVESEDEYCVDEEPYTKNEIIDAEATEADADYCSGDSMDEGERREMEENEISEGGESIGSEDTKEDPEVDDADDKSEDSFIASSEEDDLLEYSDDDEHLDIGRKGISKRIYKPLIDSDSADEQKATNTGTPKSKKINENKNENLSVETADKAEEGVVQMPLSLEVSKMIDESITDEEMLGKSEKRWSSANGGPKIAAGEVMNEENKQQCDEALVSIANKFNTTLSEHESSNAVNEDKSIDSNDSTTLSGSALILRASSSENDSYEDGKKAQKQNASRNESLKEMIRSELFSSKVIAQNDEQLEKRNVSKSHGSQATEEVIVAGMSSDQTDEKCLLAYSRNPSKEKGDVFEFNISGEITGNISTSIERQSLNKSAKSSGLDLRKSLNKSLANDKSLNGSLKQSESPKGTTHGNSNESDTDGENEKETNTSNFTTRKHSNASLCGKGKQVGETPDTAEDADSEQELSENEVFSSEIKTSTSNSLNCSILAATNNNSSESESPEEEEDMSDHNNADEVESEADETANRDENKTEDTSDSCGVDENDVVEQLRGSDTNGSANPENERALSSEDEQQLEKLKYQTKLSASFSEHLARRQTLGLSGMAGTDDGAEKRHMSKSFCSSLNTTLPKMAKSETTNDLAAASTHRSTPLAESAIDKTTNNIERIFKRCEEIIEAANRYKLNAKINFKKSKITLNKKQQQQQQAVAVGSDSEESKLTSEAVVVNQSLDRKRKEKTKSAVEQALKASANILLNPPYKKKHKKCPKLDEQNLESKHLPTQLLEALSNNADVVPNKKRKMHYNEQENPDEYHKIKSAVGYINEFPLSPKEKKKTKTIKLATGTVCVEPLTPKKKDNISGFRECPLTPHTTGFKVRQILTAGQDTPPEYAASSSLTRKRKRIMVEPTHTLPKPQWTQSGVFLEQKILPSRIVSTHSSTTQFIVSALNETKKTKDISASALKFKQNSISHSKATRETSREVLLRKERQYVNNRY